ncbi:hypothetical protein [Chitinophaga silvisoli]|uniref:hypothetical protein n=1 Tax=Chitinophaga silvisoli TaxID=2291814 RepID=UPI000E317C97|nr:hypothetical protein [Chitinophaga silvisoli]
MKKQIYFIAGIFLFVTCFWLGCSSCERHKKINARNSALIRNKDSVDFINRRIQATNSQITSLATEKDAKVYLCNSLYDSLHLTIHNYPWASSFIFAFDKEPIEIFWDYANKKTPEEMDNLLKMQVVLAAYSLWGNNADTINLVRSKFKYYDYLKHNFLDEIGQLKEQLKPLQASMKEDSNTLKVLDKQQDIISKELETLNAEGIL